MTTTKTYKIPFTKDGTLLSHEYPYGHMEIDWKDIFVFDGRMKYDGFGRGRSAATIYMKDLETGKRYPMFLSTFDDLMKSTGRFAFDGGTGSLIFTGNWTFCKKGQNYAMMPTK
jgi:hypothetical protein